MKIPHTVVAGTLGSFINHCEGTVFKNTINGLSVLKGFINARLTQQLVGQDLQASLHGIMWSGSSSTVLMVLCRTKDRRELIII